MQSNTRSIACLSSYFNFRHSQGLYRDRREAVSFWSGLLGGKSIDFTSRNTPCVQNVQNEPYATRHELAQARRLVDLLSREFSASDVHVWLCLNFSFGGKSIDGALITPEKFAILEFKAVGGDVDCGASLENSQWVWRDYPHDDGHVIATPPYANPFSQAKNYRTAIVGGFEQRQRGFLRSTTLLKAEIKFAWWVKCCVLMSRRDASDVRVNIGELSYGTQKWFCCGTLGNAVHLMEGLESSVKMAPKEVDRLIENVLGLRHVDTVLEEVSIESGSQPVQLPSIVSMSPTEQFRKRYRSERKEMNYEYTNIMDESVCSGS